MKDTDNVITCPTCGQAGLEGDTFCGSCGASMVAGQSVQSTANAGQVRLAPAEERSAPKNHILGWFVAGTLAFVAYAAFADIDGISALVAAILAITVVIPRLRRKAFGSFTYVAVITGLMVGLGLLSSAVQAANAINGRPGGGFASSAGLFLIPFILALIAAIRGRKS